MSETVTVSPAPVDEKRVSPPSSMRKTSNEIEGASAQKLPAYGSVSDEEKADSPDVVGAGAPSAQGTTSMVKRYWKRFRWVFHLFIFMLFTGWWIASLVLHRKDKNWVVPFLLWLAITLRLIFNYVPSSHLSRALKLVWAKTALVVYDRLPEKSRTPLGALVTIGAILIGTFVTSESNDNNRENRAVSLFGIVVLLFVLWATSKHRHAVEWRTVIGGMLAQYIIALFVLRTGVGYDIFKFIADRAADLLSFARKGTEFLTTEEIANQQFFFFSVIPAIMFFISLVQVLFHIGFLQWFIVKMATFVFWLLRVSGSEAVVAAATPFIGQGESAMLVRPFVPHMTKAELHQIMTCGFATISGSTLVAYVGMGLNPQALVSSCIMSIPAALAISKLRYPETEETLTAGKVVIPEDQEEKAENALHAFANGAWFGIKIAGTIVATLLCIIAAVGLIDGLLGWWGHYLNINSRPLSLELIMGYICYPVAFLLGVPRTGDLYKVAQIIATKIIKNEFAAFLDLSAADLSPRSTLIATYAICGFGNIGSLGIQIGILSQIAPTRGGDVSKLAFSAFVSGVFSTLTSAAVAGLVVSDESSILQVPAS
ncbi:related to sodium/nucleoside cotransporter 1 [Cephalotrichum gorgonifer]|uniref:Related to sodium/nucleoside cotransporter 1 n=1 Tax=Cephalotrichum gorgonifer TaxID=2041049 RepID=A0AAE8N591_9PEZI|nr:related to sodium/nucleoside cotransporter 1 [Cephalotrichum gorgonifer]